MHRTKGRLQRGNATKTRSFGGRSHLDRIASATHCIGAFAVRVACERGMSGRRAWRRRASCPGGAPVELLTSWASVPFMVVLGVALVFALLQMTGILGLLAGGGDHDHDVDA